MSGNYSQKVYVKVPTNVKIGQLAGSLLLLAALALFVTAIEVNYYCFIAFAVAFVGGIVVSWSAHKSTMAYVYDCSSLHLVIASQDVVKRTKRIATIAFDDATEYAAYVVAEWGDLIACALDKTDELKTLSYVDDGVQKRLVFAPDAYMDAKIKSIIATKEA